MLPNLELWQVGTRHVVSDGVNDLGCIGEAHLKSCVASLPGARGAAVHPNWRPRRARSLFLARPAAVFGQVN